MMHVSKMLSKFSVDLKEIEPATRDLAPKAPVAESQRFANLLLSEATFSGKVLTQGDLAVSFRGEVVGRGVVI